MSWLTVVAISTEMNNLVLGFDGFGRDYLAAEAALVGGGLADVLQLAVRHYLSELDRDRFALRVPEFARTRRRTPELEFGVDLDEAALAALTSEADRQGLAVEELLGHAALLYLADQDAGRFALGA